MLKKKYSHKKWMFALLLYSFILYGKAQNSSQVLAVHQLVERVLQFYADSFRFELLPIIGKDSFAITTSEDGKILILGNNGVSMASGFYTYLSDYCHCNITWDSRQLHIPVPMPKPAKVVGKSTLYNARYYLNYCTYNYSMSWWDWDRWQKEIDWMAMNGINMPLALTGEEAIWKNVYMQMGLKDGDLNDFFSGPAYFSWFWMGNLDGWNGPLTDHWMERQKDLQLKILERERVLGMTPVLPAFTGHVPKALIKYYPNAKIKKTNWGAGFDDVFILEPGDSLFDKIGKLFLKKQSEVYGTDHLYSADTFNENVPPSNDSSYLDGITKKIYATMQAVDPKAKWLMQGWMFHYNKDYWGEKQVSSLLHAVPGDNLIILDLYSESYPMWKQSHSYYGKPWIWNMLQNFGGNIGMFGRMGAISHDPYTTYKDSTSGNMQGIGLTPEGIEQNPALFSLMLQNVWEKDTIAVGSFLKKYALNRYGGENTDIDKAWNILYKTVYDGGLGEGTPESIIVSHPMMKDSSQRVRTSLNYNPKMIITAWSLFMNTSKQLCKNEGYLYDLTDITRQVLANYAFDLFRQWRMDYQQGYWTEFKKHSNAFLALMKDLDRLLGSNRHFLLGKWIADARYCGITEEEKNLYEKNARDLVTLWGGRASGLSEYSNRLWAGLIKDYYLPRWKMYFDFIYNAHKKNEVPNLEKINKTILDWEWKWVNRVEPKYASIPVGDNMKELKRIYDKYHRMIECNYF